MSERLHRLLTRIYGPERATEVEPRLAKLLAQHGSHSGSISWSEQDVWLITYPDQFQRLGESPLETLDHFYARYLADHLNGVHVLPFYPWSSDDGFSVEDYDAVEPTYGTWDDVTRLSRSARLMVDGVINHMSAESDWFEGFLTGDPRFEGFFKTADPAADLSSVVRPRTHPLLTRFDGVDGDRWVWTTFSSDQVDLDYGNPEVLLRVIESMLGYANRGADVIRLDAIGFLWKQEGTASIHLPQTHAIIQLIRACLDETYPATLLISETNVPHAENVSYLGAIGEPEANAVYQFSLPPLVLHATLSGDATELRSWAAEATNSAGPGRTFFNFLSSHDGVGVRPVEDLLSPEAVKGMVDACLGVGGQINRRTAPSGEEVPYELNSTWFDLMSSGVGEDQAVRRHLAAHAAMLAMPGIAGIYVHSLFGSSNDQALFESTGQNRSLNRHKFDSVSTLEGELADTGSRASRVLKGMEEIIEARRSTPAFHPDATLTVLDGPKPVLGLERATRSGVRARAYVNFGNDIVQVETTGFRRTDGRTAPSELAPSEWLMLVSVD